METEILLLPSIVAFVDVLGTKVMASNQVEELKRLIAARTRASAFADGAPSYESVTFTDNTVLRWKSEGRDGEPVNRSLAWLPDDLAAFQLAFAVNGLLLRGAVEVGHLAIGSDFVFGDALTRAYRSEGATAVWPRIVLSKDALHRVTEATILASDGDEAAPSFILIDDDGHPFVHYLGWASKSGDPALYLDQHRRWLLSRLREQRQAASASDKLRWAIDYHNFSVRSGGYPEGLTIGHAECGRQFTTITEART